LLPLTPIKNVYALRLNFILNTDVYHREERRRCQWRCVNTTMKNYNYNSYVVLLMGDSLLYCDNQYPK
jgi:hypothetical protein